MTNETFWIVFCAAAYVFGMGGLVLFAMWLAGAL